MKRVLSYKVEGDSSVRSVEFEDEGSPITITPPNRDTIEVLCGSKTILSCTGIPITYIQID